MKTFILCSVCWTQQWKPKRKIVQHQRSYNEDENDYDNVYGAVENNEKRENFDKDDYNDDDDDDDDGKRYDVDYKKNKPN